MTRKNYVDMADRFGERLRIIQRANIIPNAKAAKLQGFWFAVDGYMEAAKADNKNFDRDRFLEAVRAHVYND